MNTTLRKTGYELLDIDAVRGEGCYIYDESGKKYLDFESGVWCCALGHNNPNINNAIKKQLDKIVHTGYTFINKTANNSSKKILDSLSIVNGKCSFLSSGTEAVELAVRIAKIISKNEKTLILSGQYFGSYGSAMRKDNNEFYTFDYNKCKKCNISDDCNSSCSNLLRIPFEQIDTFLFEPGGKGGLAQFPPKGLINNISKIIKKKNGFIIVNEVTTGLGRTGKWYGFQHYDIYPDIIALGKILGNGYPVSAVALNSNASEALDASEFYYGQSHTNDPLSCIVAEEVLNVIINEDLINRSKEIGHFFYNKLHEVSLNTFLIKEIRGRGMIMCVEFNKHISTEILLILYHKLIENGYIVGLIKSMNSIRFMPPFIINKEEVNNFIECFKNIIIEVEKIIKDDI